MIFFPMDMLNLESLRADRQGTCSHIKLCPKPKGTFIRVFGSCFKSRTLVIALHLTPNVVLESNVDAKVDPCTPNWHGSLVDFGNMLISMVHSSNFQTKVM